MDTLRAEGWVNWKSKTQQRAKNQQKMMRTVLRKCSEDDGVGKEAGEISERAVGVCMNIKLV